MKNIEVITSKSNPRLKELRKLQDKKHRSKAQQFVAEGEDLLAAAASCGYLPQVVFFEAGCEEALNVLLGEPQSEVELVPVEREALNSASSLGSGSRMIGIWRQRWAERSQIKRAEVVVYLHDLSDPANVGSIIRSANALARSAVVLSDDCADPFSPKAVRASMGAIFGEPIVRFGFQDTYSHIGQEFKVVALVPEGGDRLSDLDLSNRTMLCLGSERVGLPEEIVKSCGAIGNIPMQEGAVESLNVAQAASIALYQCLLHRIGD